jgi:hypothetical protein
MDLSDERWSTLRGGYGTLYDPRGALHAVEMGADTGKAWAELWENLHHQGDIGEASFAAVPQIARLVVKAGMMDWNPYALAATIEEARHSAKNPPLPEWLSHDYTAAWSQLFEAGLASLGSATNEPLICSIMAVLAAHKQQPMLARMSILTEAEREAMLDEVGWA